MRYIYSILVLFVFLSQNVFAQSDSVDVTFFYKPADNPDTVYLRGEFNGWNLNSLMTNDLTTGVWSKTVRLRVSGPSSLPSPNSIPGAYQYKIYADSNWMSDPLNPRQNPNDNNNSYLYTKNPTIHYLLPNSTPESGIIRTRFPEITAYIFPAKNSAVDTSSLKITIDDDDYTGIGDLYYPQTNLLTFIPPQPLSDGEHKLKLTAMSSQGSTVIDSTTFVIQGGLVQILSFPAETWKSSWRIQGAVYKENGEINTTIDTAYFGRGDSTWMVSVNEGFVDTTLYLLQGANEFILEVGINGVMEPSEPINVNRLVELSPRANIKITQMGENIILSASESNSPTNQQLTYLWSEDQNNPEALGIIGQTEEEIQIAKPSTSGEYFISLTVKDSSMLVDSTRSFFVVEVDNFNIQPAKYNDNPEWVKNGNIYLLFFKAFTPEGTIKAAIPNLEYIKAMGFNIIWVLPITEVPGNIDNQINIGYYTKDFLKVEPSLGTEEDYKNFVDAAHELGIKVIQDITPNHTGNVHPFAVEASLAGSYSQYWNYYQTEPIPHNTNGLGECVTSDGIYYYCAFSDVLLNYDWSDLDAQKYMIDVYKYWVNEFGIDGYRFDVYWGPHRKYGEKAMGIPVRSELKHIKPDILLLGEDDGVGVGTEVLYADKNGGLDASYDFRLYFDGIRGFGFSSASVNTLHSKLNNAGFFPGENSYYLRFMESQDEDRISYIYNSFEKTSPMATAVFMAPGMPMILNGQEVGFGKGMGNPGEPDLNDRRRGIIDWNFGGKDLLTPHYQKLGQIRRQFKAFSQHRKDTNGDGNVNAEDKSDFDRLDTGNGIVYSFLRPCTDSNGFIVVNFSSSSQNVTIDLASSNLEFSTDFTQGNTYWINDHYNGISTQVLGSDLADFQVSLDSYKSAIYTISVEKEMVDLPDIPSIVSVRKKDNVIPSEFTLFQNYPNPFNPSTTINFSIPEGTKVNLKVYDVLGRIVETLVDEHLSAGQYSYQFNASNLASGIYFYRLTSGEYSKVKKLSLLK